MEFAAFIWVFMPRTDRCKNAWLIFRVFSSRGEASPQSTSPSGGSDRVGIKQCRTDFFFPPTSNIDLYSNLKLPNSESVRLHVEFTSRNSHFSFFFDDSTSAAGNSGKVTFDPTATACMGTAHHTRKTRPCPPACLPDSSPFILLTAVGFFFFTSHMTLVML